MCAVDIVSVGVEKLGYVIYPGRIALRGLVERWGGGGVIPEDGGIDTAEKGFPRDFTPPETEWWVNRRDPEGLAAYYCSEFRVPLILFRFMPFSRKVTEFAGINMWD